MALSRPNIAKTLALYSSFSDELAKSMFLSTMVNVSNSSREGRLIDLLASAIWRTGGTFTKRQKSYLIGRLYNVLKNPRLSHPSALRRQGRTT